MENLIEKNLIEKKLLRAKLRVEAIKKFYKHIVTYTIVNLFLAFFWNFSFKIFGDFKVSNQFDGDGFTHIPICLVWGIFLVFHGLKTFGYLKLFDKDWEKRKIKEFMKE